MILDLHAQLAQLRAENEALHKAQAWRESKAQREAAEIAAGHELAAAARRAAMREEIRKLREKQARLMARA